MDSGVGAAAGTGIKVCLEPSSHTGVGIVLSLGLFTKQPSGTRKQLSLPPRDRPMQIWLPPKTTSPFWRALTILGAAWVNALKVAARTTDDWKCIVETEVNEKREREARDQTG